MPEADSGDLLAILLGETLEDHLLRKRIKPGFHEVHMALMDALVIAHRPNRPPGKIHGQLGEFPSVLSGEVFLDVRLRQPGNRLRDRLNGGHDHPLAGVDLSGGVGKEDLDCLSLLLLGETDENVTARDRVSGSCPPPPPDLSRRVEPEGNGKRLLRRSDACCRFQGGERLGVRGEHSPARAVWKINSPGCGAEWQRPDLHGDLSLVGGVSCCLDHAANQKKAAGRGGGSCPPCGPSIGP